jgi:hypothetical protein
VSMDDNDAAVAALELTEKQREEAEERTSVSFDVVHEAIRKDDDEELNRAVSALSWSGLAAGMSTGFSFVAEACFTPTYRRRNGGTCLYASVTQSRGNTARDIRGLADRDGGVDAGGAVGQTIVVCRLPLLK